jgi:hypothetical protein
MKITIQTSADFTPAGARSYRVAPYGRPVIVWYVSSKKYRSLPLSVANLALSQQWKGA